MAVRIGIEDAKKLHQIGFTNTNMEEWYRHAFVRAWRVKDEAVEKYGELSDDGFYELTKNGGGKCKWEEIYTNDWSISDFHPMNDQEYYLSPTLDEVQAFLRKTYHKHITIYSISQESWQYRITNPGQLLEDGEYNCDFPEYEDAQLDAIQVCIKEILSNNE